MTQNPSPSAQPVAIITGAAQGIGRRTAELFAERGFDLVLSDLIDPRATVEATRALGASVEIFLGDVSQETVVKGIVAATRAKFNRADVLVNNAGISFITPAEETTLEGFRRVLDVNIVGPFCSAVSLDVGCWRKATGR
jgi:NAD(P)-dependent dehydrogenase (short-subunit alcohol dehydrogenase family)